MHCIDSEIDSEIDFESDFEIDCIDISGSLHISSHPKGLNSNERLSVDLRLSDKKTCKKTNATRSIASDLSRSLLAISCGVWRDSCFSGSLKDGGMNVPMKQGARLIDLFLEEKMLEM